MTRIISQKMIGTDSPGGAVDTLVGLDQTGNRVAEPIQKKSLWSRLPWQRHEDVLSGTLSPSFDATGYIQEALDEYAGLIIESPRGILHPRKAMFVHSGTKLYLGKTKFIANYTNWIDSGIADFLYGEPGIDQDTGFFFVNEGYQSAAVTDKDISIQGGQYIRQPGQIFGHAIFFRKVRNGSVDRVYVEYGANGTAFLGCYDTNVTNISTYNVYNAGVDHWEGSGVANINNVFVYCDHGDTQQGVQFTGQPTLSSQSGETLMITGGNIRCRGMRNPAGMATGFMINALNNASSVKFGNFSGVLVDDCDYGIVLQGDVQGVRIDAVIRNCDNIPINFAVNSVSELDAPSGNVVDVTLTDCHSATALITIHGSNNIFHVKKDGNNTGPLTTQFWGTSSDNTVYGTEGDLYSDASAGKTNKFITEIIRSYTNDNQTIIAPAQTGGVRDIIVSSIGAGAKAGLRSPVISLEATTGEIDLSANGTGVGKISQYGLALNSGKGLIIDNQYVVQINAEDEVELKGFTRIPIFKTRASFISNLSNLYTRQNDTVIMAGGLYYKRVLSSTVIPDIPGWEPIAPVCVKHFGEAGTGSGNDSVVLQNAIDGAYSLDEPLFLNEGVYLVSPNAVTGKGSLYANNPNTTIIKANNAAFFNLSGLLLYQTKSNFTIENIGFDISSGTFSAGTGNPGNIHWAVQIQSCTNWVFKNCKVLGIQPQTIGLAVDAGSRFDILDNYFHMATPSGSYNQGINISNASGLPTYYKVSRNTLVNTGMLSNGANGTIESNMISGWGFGGGIVTGPNNGCKYHVIVDNTCVGGVGVDINDVHPSGIENWSSHSIITNNRCFGNSGNGIGNGGFACTISNNHLYDNGILDGSGLTMVSITYGGQDYNASKCIVSDNIIVDSKTTITQTYGIDESIVGGPVISDNYYHNNRIEGYVIKPIDYATTTHSFKGPQLMGTKATNPGSIVSGAIYEDTLTITGAKPGDLVKWGYTGDTRGFSITPHVLANTVIMEIQNISGADKVFPACDLKIGLEKPFDYTNY
jgi:hypothetical protein